MTSSRDRPPLEGSGPGAATISKDRGSRWQCGTYRSPQRSASPSPQQRLANGINAARVARLRRVAVLIHGLGPRPLYELLAELDAGADLDDALERYARLDRHRDFIAAAGGDQLSRTRIVGESS